VIQARAVPVITLLAGVLLSACSLSYSGESSGPAWHKGYNAGKAARSHHSFPDKATVYHVTTFCAQAAFHDIRAMKTAVLEWTEGFEKGCLGSLGS
jgi:hypothetical protein